MVVQNNEWMNLGITQHRAANGDAYKSSRSAMRHAAFKSDDSARVVVLDDGFVVLTGKEMTKEEALLFREHYLPYRHENMLHAEGVFEKHRKPWPLEQPILCSKNNQAKKILGLYYWQMPFDEARKKSEYRGLPYRTWQRGRIKHGLVIDE
ncbi:hypothetical protein PVK63_13860 [Aliivibrio sp. S2TY2]|uniref:hypothetical protein n=1 Tax=unclassified Aliivibrio TaxID=2645654 RepID=UPI002378739C|nr:MULTISPECIES: hypothetical protein [unclassified Aliivibrio]MDD9176058.1 hypothetical protein [Aliivibrio sp. S3TY1]MDD9193028.1 hypothetical protein [Aliivibrio sp. S2TY2]